MNFKRLVIIFNKTQELQDLRIPGKILGIVTVSHNHLKI